MPDLWIELEFGEIGAVNGVCEVRSMVSAVGTYSFPRRGFWTLPEGKTRTSLSRRAFQVIIEE
jgi:hypothetical protein